MDQSIKTRATATRSEWGRPTREQWQKIIGVVTTADNWTISEIGGGGEGASGWLDRHRLEPAAERRSSGLIGRHDDDDRGVAAIVGASDRWLSGFFLNHVRHGCSQ